MPPASVMMIDSTAAKIGRSMKKRENTEFLTSRFMVDREFRGSPAAGRREAGSVPEAAAASATAATGSSEVRIPSTIEPIRRTRGEANQVRLAQRVDQVEEDGRQDDAEDRHAQHAR